MTTTRGEAAGTDTTRPGSGLPGDSGFWTFLAADTVLFAVLFGQFSVDRLHKAAAFAAGHGLLEAGVATVNTAVLVTSSWALAAAMQSRGRGDHRRARRLVLVTVALGAVFATLKVGEYAHLLHDDHRPTSSPFLTYYFVITGIHLLHLIVGAAVLLVLGLRSGGRLLREERHERVVECGAAYWHVVDLLWMLIFPLLYLTR